MKNVYVFIKGGQDKLLKVKAIEVLQSYGENNIKNIDITIVDNALHAGFLMYQIAKIKSMWGLPSNNVYVYLDEHMMESNVCVCLLADASYAVSTIKNDFFYFVQHDVQNFFTYFTNGTPHDNFVNICRVASHLAIGQDASLELEGTHEEVALTGRLYSNIITDMTGTTLHTNILYQDLKSKHRLADYITVKISGVELDVKFAHELNIQDLNCPQIYKNSIYPSCEFASIHLSKNYLQDAKNIKIGDSVEF